MKLSALLGACVGAAIGTLIWALIARFANYELAIVAWAIGGMVGFGAAVFKGRGFAMGSVCAILALAAIFMGKVYGCSYLVSNEMDRLYSRENMLKQYDMYMAEAQDFSQIKSEEEYPQFLIDHEYVNATIPADITPKDISNFKASVVPHLIAFNNSPPEFEQWRAERKAGIKNILMSYAFLRDRIISHLGLFDILFAFLGIATAFKVGSGMAEEA